METTVSTANMPTSLLVEYVEFITLYAVVVTDFHESE